MAQLKATDVHGGLTVDDDLVVRGRNITCNDANLKIDKINGKYLYQTAGTNHSLSLLYFDSTNKILYVNIPSGKNS